MTIAPPPPPPLDTGRGAERSHWRRPWRFVVLGLVSVFVGLSAWFVLDLLSARTHLTAAAATVQELQAAVVAGNDPSDVDALTRRLQSDTSAATAATDGPHWWVARHLPWLGASFTGVATVADVVDDLAHDALPQLAAAGSVRQTVGRGSGLTRRAGAWRGSRRDDRDDRVHDARGG